MTLKQSRTLFGVIVKAISKKKGYHYKQAQKLFKLWLKSEGFIQNSRTELTDEQAHFLIEKFTKILKIDIQKYYDLIIQRRLFPRFRRHQKK